VPVVSGSIENYKFKIGHSVLFKDGSDVAIIACGIMVAAALDAGEMLSKEGISARVINMHTIKPIDKNAVIQAAKETGAIVVAEEHSIIGGLGSAVGDIVLQENPVPVIKVGVADVFAESGSPADLLEKYGLTAKDIVKAARLSISKKRNK
jgi:transketolase